VRGLELLCCICEKDEEFLNSGFAIQNALWESYMYEYLPLEHNVPVNIYVT